MPLNATAQVIADNRDKGNELADSLFRARMRYFQNDSLRAYAGFMFEEIPDTLPKRPDVQNFLVGLRFNALYYLGAIANIGVDVPVAPHWSIAANWQYTWVKQNTKHYYWQTFGGDVSARFWFGKRSRTRALTGHFVGTYFQMLTYDVEFGKKGYQATKWNIGYGLEYGYSARVARNLQLEVNVGFGQLGGEVKEYIPKNNYYLWTATKNRSFAGPTKAGITLVWLVGERLYNLRREREEQQNYFEEITQ